MQYYLIKNLSQQVINRITYIVCDHQRPAASITFN